MPQATTKTDLGVQGREKNRAEQRPGRIRLSDWDQRLVACDPSARRLYRPAAAPDSPTRRKWVVLVARIQTRLEKGRPSGRDAKPSWKGHSNQANAEQRPGRVRSSDSFATFAYTVHPPTPQPDNPAAGEDQTGGGR